MAYMNAEDLFSLQFLQSGEFSPDGSQVVYAVSHVDTEVDKERCTIWLISLDSGESRQMTSGQTHDSLPKFSPDGKTIAFLSTRGEKSQLYQLPIAGGEARQLTNLPQGVASGPVWSPDGATIAFTAFPDHNVDLKKDVYRVTRNVYRFDDIGYLDQHIQDIHVVNVANGKTNQLTNDDTDNGGLKWSPDGAKILYQAGKHPNRFESFYSTFRTVDLEGNVVDLPTKSTRMSGAVWSKDGQQIICIGLPEGEVPIGTKSDVWVMDVATGTVENRTAELAVGTGGGLSLRMPTRVLAGNPLPIANDGESVFVKVQEGGNLHVYRVALTGDERWKAVVTGDRGCSVLGMNNGRLLLAISDLNTPPNLYTANLDGSDEKQLTQINETFLSTVELPETEHLLFKGQDGAQVEGWYMKPPVGEAPYPTILYIHGGPHAGYGRGFAFDFQMLAGQGYGVLFLNHRASTGYGDSFSTAIKGDWGNLDYGDLMAGVDYAIAQGLADGDRLGCCGTSGGGNLSSWIVGQTDRFKAAVPQNPVTNWVSFYGTSDIGVWFGVEQMGGHPHEIPEVYAKCSPITYAHRCTTPTLMVQSELDWRCPAEQSEQFYTVLKANGCTAEMLRQPGGYHGASIRGAINLRREHLLAMLDWFGKYV
ncbi:MAG: S9 family peptidase [Chloroflexi bacterium]|nr:S9 family peptidase [Chloroflexota bacterium]